MWGKIKNTEKNPKNGKKNPENNTK